MLTMKSDKGGAAAAMGIVKAASALALPLEVHAVLGCTENMIGANAYKPDDIVTARNGKTIEVVNTDAEGRLILAVRHRASLIDAAIVRANDAVDRKSVV